METKVFMIDDDFFIFWTCDDDFDWVMCDDGDVVMVMVGYLR